MKENAPAPAVVLVKAREDDHELCCDLVDCSLRADAYIPKGQMLGILRRPTSDVWLITVEGEIVGFAITYRKSFLHNLHLAPWARGRGLGSIVLEKLKPLVVRSKTNMLAGDPSPFYAQNGYVEVERDKQRPHIALMARNGHAHAAEATAKPQEEVEMIEQLLRIFRTRTAAEAPRPAPVNEQLESDRGMSPRESQKEEMLTISKTEYEQMQLDIAKWNHRKEKQAGYQRKRQMKVGKMKNSTGEQDVLIM